MNTQPACSAPTNHSHEPVAQEDKTRSRTPSTTRSSPGWMTRMRSMRRRELQRQGGSSRRSRRTSINSNKPSRVNLRILQLLGPKYLPSPKTPPSLPRPTVAAAPASSMYCNLHPPVCDPADVQGQSDDLNWSSPFTVEVAAARFWCASVFIADILGSLLCVCNAIMSPSKVSSGRTAHVAPPDLLCLTVTVLTSDPIALPLIAMRPRALATSNSSPSVHHKSLLRHVPYRLRTPPEHSIICDHARRVSLTTLVHLMHYSGGAYAAQ